MTEFSKVKKVNNSERNAILSSSSVPPVISPFPKALSDGRTIELARVAIDLRREPSGVLVLANINWSASFPSGTYTTGGWAEITFELLRDGAIICQVHQSVVQGETDGVILPPTLTIFSIAALHHFDTAPLNEKTGKVIYILRATNIILVDPLGGNPVATTANVGAVTLTAQQIEACLPK
ncbi:hypothetical protein SDC9_132684 [bioreactor metagenome]|uniref:Uncharacterized protein n=1 Tax=bioreactor metagenome TaxID=1076179 RepID=A0A645D9J2_9ZZZZ